MAQLVEVALDVVYFDKQSSKVSRAEEVEKVKNLAQFLKSHKIWERYLIDERYSFWTAHVNGYASSEGNPSYNLEISLKRARAVRDVLIAEGVSILQFDEPRGMGTSPWAVPETAKNPKELEKQRQQNRRAEILLRFVPAPLDSPFLVPPPTPPPPVPDVRSIKNEPKPSVIETPRSQWPDKVPSASRGDDIAAVNRYIKKHHDNLKKHHLTLDPTIKSTLGKLPQYVDGPDDGPSGGAGDD